MAGMAEHNCLPGWLTALLVGFPPFALGAAAIALLSPYSEEAAIAVGAASAVLIIATAVAYARDTLYHRKEKDHA